MISLPGEIVSILEKLEKGGFEAYLVGGVSRDLLMGKSPKDWDITTNALPKEIQKIFPKNFYHNEYGTVSIHTESFGIVEITTYRTESEYEDGRHPSDVAFTRKLEEDLVRRDFTMNAIAINKIGEITDLFGGVYDIEKNLIRAVGQATERFSEDALRMLRAVRFSVQLGFEIEEKTLFGIKQSYDKLSKISAERIRDEFSKIILSDSPTEGVLMLDELHLLQYIIPELLFCKGVSQNHHHTYTVFKHLVQSLKHCPSEKLAIRIAALLHDIGKPGTKEGEGDMATFYGHEMLGAKITEHILSRLKYPKKFVEYVTHLVRHHMFFYEETITDAAVRRILKRIGPENFEDFIELRVADRLGSGVREPKSWRLKEFERRAHEVRHHPISTHDLEISGNEIMEILQIKPGKEIGEVMNHLLFLVIEDPERNNVDWLKSEVEKWKSGNPTKPEISEEELEKKREEVLVQDF